MDGRLVKRWTRAVVGLVALVAALALSAGSASAEYGITTIDGDANDVTGAPMTQAGGHADVRLQLDFSTKPNPFSRPPEVIPDGTTRSIEAELPPGLVGNPQAGCYYPPVWLAWRVGRPSVLGWLTVAHLAWAGLGAYVLTRALGYCRPAAVVAAVLSCWLILMGWSLMGDAVSHAVLPGVALSYIIGIPFSIGAFVFGALAVALIAVVVLALTGPG